MYAIAVSSVCRSVWWYKCVPRASSRRCWLLASKRRTCYFMRDLSILQAIHWQSQHSTNHLPPPWMVIALKDATGALSSYWMCKQESKHSGSVLKQRQTQALNTYTRVDVSRPAAFDSNGVGSLCVWCCVTVRTMLCAECLDSSSNYLAIIIGSY
jgi:hypothetical protein